MVYYKTTYGILWFLVLSLLAACDGTKDDSDFENNKKKGGPGDVDSDSDSDSDYYVADCDPADPDLAEADAAELFGYPEVPKFDIYLPPETWENLKEHAMDEEVWFTLLFASLTC